jgi:hypothetical protein
MTDELKVNVGCGGCLGTILIVVIVWALLFGVTIGGHHYGLDECSCDKGVVVHTGE